MTRWFSLALLLGVIVIVSIFFYRVMAGFLLPLFLAGILVVMFRPLHQWVLKKLPERERLAALITTIAIALVVLLPIALVTTLAAMEASSMATQLHDAELSRRMAQLRASMGMDYEHVEELRYLESSLESLRGDAALGASATGDATAVHRLFDVVKQLQRDLTPTESERADIASLRDALERLDQLCLIPAKIGTLEYQSQLRDVTRELRVFKVKLLGGEFSTWLKEVSHPTAEDIRSLTDRVFAGTPGFLRAIGGATSTILGGVLLGVSVMVLAVYFFLADGPRMISTLMRLSPLDDRHETELVAEFDRISRAVVIATLLSAAVQAVLAAIGFWFADLGSVFLLMMITFVFALVPFVGAATVWIPACLWLYFYESRPTAAIVLAVYSAVVVSMADNIIKPIVLHGQSNLHPLLALLSVIGGVQALGPIGILVGPMLVVFLQTLLNILHRELTTFEKKPVREG